ncbi:hypothetical protein DL240_16515 [Lujinxingia litoralis]|uniref:TadE-like domain-containing protein n=2 Tax=Lujinxingia litoralis TaxID=2211119 RepID=A0A328C2I3_9DELT|nr:hypothetical protein DL240_16515 [Lujinxingia litoralis]
MLAQVGLHVGGLVAVAAGLLFWQLPGEHLRLMWASAAESTQVGTSVAFSGVLHLGIAALVWGLVYGAGALVKRGLARDVSNPRRFKPTQGAVFVETLVVFPVFLLLTFGLLQLSIVNLTAALMQVAGYQGARAAWVWQPEADAGRSGVDQAEVNERARIAVALVMAPVVAGDIQMVGREISPQAEAMARAMYVRFALDVSAGGLASLLFPVGGNDPTTELSAARAFDSDGFDRRAVRKFLFSYMMTEMGEGLASSDGIGVIHDGNSTGVRFKFHHYLAMPLVGGLFGEPKLFVGMGGRRGYYRTWEHEYVFPRQPHGVNRHTP